MLGRIAPIKHIELALEAVKIVVSSGSQISMNIVGSPSQKDLGYYKMLERYTLDNNLTSYVNFVDEVSLDKHPEIFSSNEVCLNLTESGSFDKSIVGASACGAIPLVTNKSLKSLLPEVCFTENSPEAIANSLKKLLEAHLRVEIQPELELFVKSQSLESLKEKLFVEIQ